MGQRMTEQFKLIKDSGTWKVLALKGAGHATEATWVCLGGCPNQMVAMRVWLAVTARGTRHE